MVKTQLGSNLEEEVHRDKNSKNYPFLNQLVGNPNLHTINLLRQLGERILGFFTFLTLKKGWFHLFSKFSKEVETWYVDIVRTIYVPFRGFQLFIPIVSTYRPEMWFFGLDFSCFKFVPRTTLHRIKLGS